MKTYAIEIQGGIEHVTIQSNHEEIPVQRFGASYHGILGYETIEDHEDFGHALLKFFGRPKNHKFIGNPRITAVGLNSTMVELHKKRAMQEIQDAENKVKYYREIYLQL